MNKLRRNIKRLIRDTERAKRACAKKYPDWEDNEFNLLDCKFIWGICSSPTNMEASFCTWNDAQIYYNRSTYMYYLDIDTGFYSGIDDAESARNEIARLERIDEGFRNFLIENNLRFHSKIPCFYSPDFQLSLEASTLTELYTKFRILLEGYKWFRTAEDKLQ